MRVMFTTTGSAGHLGPLLPFAGAVRRARGEVLIATRESSAANARATGFDVWPFKDAPAAERDAAMASVRGLPLEEAHARLLKEVFGGMDARAALPGVLDACAAFAPDVVVYEPSELAGRLAAAHHRIPTVAVSITQFAVEQRREREMDEALHRLSAEHQIARPNGTAHFTLMPSVLEDPNMPGPPAGMHRFREPDGPPPAPLPDWWSGSSDPLVYVTFGSVAAQRGDIFPALYSRVIDQLAPLPVRVLVTIGRDRDPHTLGELPANVHVERWVPQHTVLPHAQAVVDHGGSGTLRAAIAAGLPQVVIPLFADQPDNAQRIAALGAGIALQPDTNDLAAAVTTILADPSYATQAAAIAAEIRSLPDVDHAATLIGQDPAQWMTGAGSAFRGSSSIST